MKAPPDRPRSCDICGSELGARFYADCPMPVAEIPTSLEAGTVLARTVHLDLCLPCHARVFPPTPSEPA